jgi:hypothetical protein
MVLLGDEAQVEADFGPFGDSVNLDSRYVHDLRQTYRRLRNHFGRTQWYTLVTRLKWKLISVCLQIVLILIKDRYIVTQNVPKAWKLFWMHPMELLGDVALVEFRFRNYKDGVCVRAR